MTEKQFWCIEGYEGETSFIVDGKFAPTNGWLCDKLNELNEEKEQLTQENKDLKCKLRNCEDARQSYKQDWKSCSSYCDEYKSKIISLEDEVKGLLEENKELNLIKCFAENNGIDIFNIEEAFRKCWDDNAKLVSENKKLIAALEKHKDDTILSDDKKYAEEREREIHQDRKMPGWMKSGRFA